MARGWLSAWALAAVAYGGGSLIVPLYVIELGGGPFTLGVLFATSSFVGVPGALLVGRLADRSVRRRPFVLVPMASAAVAMAAIPLLDAVRPVIVANALLWLSFAAALPALNLLVVVGEPPTRWTDAIADLNEAQGIGWAAGLALGFVIVAVGSPRLGTTGAQRGFFLACAACGTVGTVLAWHRLPADPDRGSARRPGRLARALARAPRFNVRGAAFPVTPGRFDPRGLHPRRFLVGSSTALVTCYGGLLLAFTGFGIFFAPLPAYLTAVGVSGDGIFGLYFALNVTAAACFGPAAGWANRFPLPNTLGAGLTIRGALFVLVVVVAGGAGGPAGFAATASVFVLMGVTWAVITVAGTALVGHLAAAGTRGEALGWYGALAATGGGIGGLTGGVLAEAGYVVAFGAAGGLVVLGALVVSALGSTGHPVDSEIGTAG